MQPQGPFTAPAKRLRAEHRRPRAERRPHGQFRPSDGRAVLYEAFGRQTWRSGRGKVADMRANSTIEPPSSPVPGVVPEPVGIHDDAGPAPTTTRPQRNPMRMVLAKMLSVIRGDKYMVDAYPPDWPGPATHEKER
jgi:hypothetical protein